METFKLVKPTIEYEKQAIDFIEEHYEYNSPLNGVGGLDKFLDNYNGWLEKLEENRNRIANEERVPTETFFFIREEDNKIVGMINIRLALNEKLRKVNGNIGYCIRPTERQKGYNKINLYLGLLECNKREMKEVMLDCDKYNLGSVKTIQALCGKLEKEYYNEEYKEEVQIYWIDVKYSIESNKERFKKYISN